MLGSRPTSSIAASYCERSEEHTSELQSQSNIVCRLLLEKKKYMDGFSTAISIIFVPICPKISPPALALLHKFYFFFNETPTTEIYTLSLHDALPICVVGRLGREHGLIAGRLAGLLVRDTG